MNVRGTEPRDRIIRIADIIAYGRDEEPVLLVEVKSRPAGPDILSQIAKTLQEVDPPIPFGMLIDPKLIVVLGHDQAGSVRELVRMDPIEILAPYEPRINDKPIFQLYLSILTESWIRDLSQHWKSLTPPGSDRLATIGLLGRLSGGTTRREVRLHGDPLR